MRLHTLATLTPDVAAAATGGQPRPVAPRWRIGEIEVDVAAQELRRRGEVVPVRRQAFEVLCLLLAQRPHTVPREALREAVWGREDVAGSAIARAVLEARRAIGDTEDAPSMIVNVHGVGYRFQGRVTDCSPPSGTASALPAVVARAQIEAVERAFWARNDPRAAQRHAEQALAAAMAGSRQVETGLALCWLGWLALWCGGVEDASRHLSHALHVAARSDDAVLQAQAGTVEAYLYLSLDDPEEAMQCLELAHPVLAEGDHAGWRFRCEALLGVAARRLGDGSAARHWCRQSQLTAQSGGLVPQWLRALGNEATLELERGDALERAGDAAAAGQAWTAALAVADRVLERADTTLDPWLAAIVTGQRGQLLGRLGCAAQARAAFDAVEALLERYPDLRMPAFLEQHLNLQADRARLSLRAGDLAQAGREIEAGFARAAGVSQEGTWAPVLHGLASEVAERRGDLAAALRCAQAQQAAQRALQDRRAQALARAMQLRLQHEAARERLESLRERVAHLERLGARLLQELHDAGRSAKDGPG